MYFFLLSYPILGAGIKYIDDAFDEKSFNKKIAYIIAPILGVLWAYTMLISPVSATILLAVLCGVFFKGKIDNYAHLAGLLVILPIVLVAGLQLLIVPLIILAVAAVLDEVGNDLIDKHRDRFDMRKFSHVFTTCFFDQRWVLKVAILFIAILGIIPIYFFIAMVLFDYSYLMVRWYSHVKQGIPSRISLKAIRFKAPLPLETAGIKKEPRGTPHSFE